MSSAHLDWEKTALISVIWGSNVIPCEFSPRNDHIAIADKHTNKDFYMLSSN